MFNRFANSATSFFNSLVNGEPSPRRRQTRGTSSSFNNNNNNNSRSANAGKKYSSSSLSSSEEEDSFNKSMSLLSVTPGSGGKNNLDAGEEAEAKGEECPICNTEYATLLNAKPCGHSACSRCWNHWQHASQRGKEVCIVCALPIASKSMVENLKSKPKRKRGHARAPLSLKDSSVVLTESYEDCLRGIVRMRNDTTAVYDSLMETKLHVFNLFQDAQEGHLDAEAALDVFQVEHITIKEELEKLFRTFSEKRFKKINLSLDDIFICMDSLSYVLREGSKANEPIKNDNVWLKNIETCIPKEAGSHSQLKSQLALLNQSIDSIFVTNLPEILNIFLLTLPQQSAELSSTFEKVRDLVDAKVKLLNTRINQFEDVVSSYVYIISKEQTKKNNTHYLSLL